MKSVVVCFAAALLLSLATTDRSTQAAPPQPQRAALKASTQTLPPALQAVQGPRAKVLNQRQAQQVRGSWWIDLPMLDTPYYQLNAGSFSDSGAALQSTSTAAPAGQIQLRVRIGR